MNDSQRIVGLENSRDQQGCAILLLFVLVFCLMTGTCTPPAVKVPDPPAPPTEKVK